MNIRSVTWFPVLAVIALSGCAAMVAELLVVPAIVMVGGVVGAVLAPADYRSRAEKEIKSGTYDPELWAEALVLVEGDEEKRYARYIELRAEQLEHEIEGSKSETNLIEPFKFNTHISETTIPGTYVSDIQRGPPYFFFDRQPWFTFEQSGNDIIGTDVSKNGTKIYGIRNGDTIKFKYWAASRLILGEWKIKPDGTGLEGTWEADNEHGSWNLTRIE